MTVRDIARSVVKLSEQEQIYEAAGLAASFLP